MKFETAVGSYEITKHQLAEIKKRIAADLKYMERHKVDVDTDLIKLQMKDARLAQAWHAKEYQKLSEHERIKAISEMIVFPEHHSRLQTENLVKASIRIGRPVTFGEALSGAVDSYIQAEAETLRAQGYDSDYIQLYVGQKYFGSK